MRAIFAPVPDAERQERLHEYAAFLAERDGEPDFANRTLSRREAPTRRLESPSLRFDGEFDAALFADQYVRFDPKRRTSDEMLMLLAFAKTNANEAYAVEQVQHKAMRANAFESSLERIVLLEETYHTRLLLSACPIFGVKVDRPSPPVAHVKRIVAGIARMPDVLSRPITLAGEIIGVMTFVRMIGAVRRVFASRPALRDALEERVTEILVDEIGHMSLNRLLSRAGTFTLLHGFLRATAIGTRGALPEAEALGVLPLPMDDVARFDISSLPDEVRRQAFVA